jgi:hypothetical protein
MLLIMHQLTPTRLSTLVRKGMGLFGLYFVASDKKIREFDVAFLGSSGAIMSPMKRFNERRLNCKPISLKS